MEVLEVRVEDLKPYENNPRKNDGAVEKVAASIKEFGFKVPVVVDSENVIIAGHTRVKAAALLGLETVPVIKADDLTPEQVKAYRLADNKVAEFSEWDFSALEAELENLEMDMSVFGFAGEAEEESGGGDQQPAESSFNYKEQYGVIVMCKDEAEQEEIYNSLTEQGYECKVVAT